MEETWACRKLEPRKIFTQLMTKCPLEEAMVNKWLGLKLAQKRIINSRVTEKTVLLVAQVNITLKRLCINTKSLKNMPNRTKAWSVKWWITTKAFLLKRLSSTVTHPCSKRKSWHVRPTNNSSLMLIKTDKTPRCSYAVNWVLNSMTQSTLSSSNNYLNPMLTKKLCMSIFRVCYQAI